jgi:acyl carrier protein
MANEIRQQIRSFILDTFLDGADAAQLEDGASLERSHIVDSARMMELILFLEETFAFEVDNEEALPENFDSVDNLVGYVGRKLGQA